MFSPHYNFGISITKLVVQNKSFWSSFLQKARGVQRQRLWSPSAEDGTLYPWKRIFWSLKGAMLGCAGNFAQSFMGKKSKLLIENKFSIHFSAREKWFKNYLTAQTIPEKFPVGSFRLSESVCFRSQGTDVPQHRNSIVPRTIYIFWRSVTGALPPYPHNF